MMAAIRCAGESSLVCAKAVRNGGTPAIAAAAASHSLRVMRMRSSGRVYNISMPTVEDLRKRYEDLTKRATDLRSYL